MKKHLLFPSLLSFALLVCAVSGWAEPPAPEEKAPAPANAESPMLEAVDTPTAEILDPMTYSVNFRFYNQGGITSRLVIGPLKRVNLGISFDAQRVIGSSDPHLIRPSVFFKLRCYDGSDLLPALALGYDNQGELYQEDTKRFLHREKGLYLVISHEILIPNLELHAGTNLYDFEDVHQNLSGFVGSTLKITHSFVLLAEYDNIHRAPDNRVNLGGRYYVAPYFYVDIAARNVGRGTARGGERIVRLNYTGNFPR